MALIKCPECSAEISDKSSSCPKCGTPIVVHEWRCLKCGNMISEEPCLYCSNAHTAANTSTVDCKSNIDTTPVFVKKNKRNLKVLISVLVSVVIVIVVIACLFLESVPENGRDSRKSTVVHGEYCDAYDDDGDGWVDRVYDRTLRQWWNQHFYPGFLAIEDCK